MQTDPHELAIGAVKSGKSPESSSRLRAKHGSENSPRYAGGGISLGFKKFPSPAESSGNHNGQGAPVTTPTVTSPPLAEEHYPEPAAQTEGTGETAPVTKKKRIDHGSDFGAPGVNAAKRDGKAAVGRRRSNVTAPKAGGVRRGPRGLQMRRCRQERGNERETKVGDEDDMEEDALESAAGRESSDSDGGGGIGDDREACESESHLEEHSHSEENSESDEEEQEKRGQDDDRKQDTRGKGKPQEISSNRDEDGGGRETLGTTQERPRDEAEEAEIEKSSGISEYELQRLERIRKNQAFMASLGLATAKLPPSVMTTTPAEGGSAAAAAAKKKKKKSRPVSRDKERAPSLPVRRSARARGAEAVNYIEVWPDGVVMRAGVLSNAPKSCVSWSIRLCFVSMLGSTLFNSRVSLFLSPQFHA